MTNAAAINWNYCPWRSVSVDIKATSLIKGFSETLRNYHKNENHDSHPYQCTTSLSWSWNCKVVACIVILILIPRSRIIPHLQDEEKWEKSIRYWFRLLSFFSLRLGYGMQSCGSQPSVMSRVAHLPHKQHMCLHTVRYFFCLHHLDDTGRISMKHVLPTISISIYLFIYSLIIFIYVIWYRN